MKLPGENGEEGEEETFVDTDGLQASHGRGLEARDSSGELSGSFPGAVCALFLAALLQTLQGLESEIRAR